MTDPLQRLEEIRERESSKRDIWADPWKPLLVLLALPLLLFLGARLLFGWDFVDERRMENSLQYCEPQPTEGCEARVRQADHVCMERVSEVHSVRSNRSSFYFGCMNSRLPGFTNRVDSPSATPGLDLSPN